jgi:hypothetical protein
VASTDGTLVCLLSTVHSFAGKVVTFPDFQKDKWYNWWYTTAWQPFAPPNGRIDLMEDCRIIVTAIEQEYDEVAQTLMPVPDGADYMMARVKINRTTAPATTWMGNTLQVLPVQDKWIPLNNGGSLLMEAAVGMARAMHLEMKDGNLVLSAQQSVGQTALNDWVAHGDAWPTGFNSRNGGVNGYVTAKGLPIFDPNTATSRKHREDSANWPTSVNRALNQGGTQECTYADVSQYQSVYSVDVDVQFGRRS